VAQRVEQLTALGNGQVPAVVRQAWRILTHNVEVQGRGAGLPAERPSATTGSASCED
jgi:hypothetical protein